MKTGFVFGKYYPFHKGHQAKIDFALRHCDKLYVLVCGSAKEKITAETRANWIRETYANNRKINLIEFTYDEAILPNTSDSSRNISKIWSEEFKAILPPVDFLVTSEKYGEYVSGFMDIKHIPFDMNRSMYSVSASQIRKDLYGKWNFLPDSVKAYFQKKIVFLGTECTGKSSISKAISKLYESSHVKEVGRDLIQNSNQFTEEKLLEVAQVHASNINRAAKELKPFVFIDTDIHITQSYSKYEFGKYMNIAPHIYNLNKADRYFYLDSSLEFEQDGTRLNESERNKLDTSHQQTLDHFGIIFFKISGDWNERLHKVIDAIASLNNIEPQA